MAAFAEGKPCWAVAMLPDVAAGRRFYGELFGWTFGEPEDERHSYTEAFLDERRVAGLVGKPDGRMPTSWGLHLATEDIVATAAKVRDAGGQIIAPPFPVGDTGITAVVTDPGGAVFQLWQGRELAGFERTGTPGGYGWSELYTRDPQEADAFYTTVFGYGTRDLTDAVGDDFVVWTPAGDPVDDDHAVLGRGRVADRYPEPMPPHFLLYFEVADCDAAVDTATALGARVLRDPEGSPYGRNAVLVDDQGAAFAVIAPATAGKD
ncbi:MAG TPA: VOC family protein [Streptomyces sp.]|jgi:predicted enzyme related to lactoylglutathione lyase|nr:VOC family protein [Streptomyces sp.]